MAVDYAQSYNATWSLRLIDKSSWTPIGTVANVASFSVDRDGTDNVPLLETGSVEIDVPLGFEFESGWYQIAMKLDQGFAGQEIVPVATLWFEAVRGMVTADRDTVRADGRSVLYPASTTVLERGEYVPKGVDGASYCAGLLRGCIPAPVNVEGKFTIEDYYVFKDKTNVLEAVWTLLDAGDFCIQIDGDGTVNVRKRPTAVSLELGKAHASMLGSSYEYTKDFSAIPNVYIAIDGEQTAKAVNDDPMSKTSTVSRGFDVTVVDTSPMRVNGETLQSYADRKLYEARTMVETVRVYSREYWPGVVPFSKVRWYEPDGLSQDQTVRSQTLTLGYGIVVKETAVVYTEE